MKRFARTIAMAMVMATLLLVAGPATAATAAEIDDGVLRGVEGKLEDGRLFKGRIKDLRFDTSPNGQRVRATGVLVGRAIADDGSVERIRQTFTTRVGFVAADGKTANRAAGIQQAVQDSCPILNLDLGPIFLDLLGLQVDLSAIELDITAVPGAGNLLGNLLCAVAGLLDPPGLLDILTGLLNGLIREL
ncbi:MAG: ABC transporter substrate-binding protein [Egibacteraceae bacterium]